MLASPQLTTPESKRLLQMPNIRSEEVGVRRNDNQMLGMAEGTNNQSSPAVNRRALLVN